jgi:Alpha-2-macroglobulin bait region domain
MSYYVVGRGNVLLFQTLDFGNQNVKTFEFDSTPSMAPASSIVVYYITETGTIVSDETEITFAPKTLLNSKFSLSLSETTLKPNQELTITIDSDSSSFVSLVSIDQNALLTKRGHELTRTRVYNELREFDNAGDMDVDANYASAFTNMLVR